MKKLNLKKITVANLTQNQLGNAKGGGPYQNSDFCGYSYAAGCTEQGCVNGTLNENCSNQINCTAGPECDYGAHPK